MPPRDEIRKPLEHSRRCPRKHAPTLRLAWNGLPEIHCPDCGHTVAVPKPQKEHNANQNH